MRHQGVQRKTSLVFFLHPIWGPHCSLLVLKCPQISAGAVWGSAWGWGGE